MISSIPSAATNRRYCTACKNNGKYCTNCKGEGFVTVPAIFHAFIPTALEYVVKGTETEKELDRMEKQGITLVKVVPIPEKEEKKAAVN